MKYYSPENIASAGSGVRSYIPDHICRHSGEDIHLFPYRCKGWIFSAGKQGSEIWFSFPCSAEVWTCGNSFSEMGFNQGNGFPPVLLIHHRGTFWDNTSSPGFFLSIPEAVEVGAALRPLLSISGTGQSPVPVRFLILWQRDFPILKVGQCKLQTLPFCSELLSFSFSKKLVGTWHKRHLWHKWHLVRAISAVSAANAKCHSPKWVFRIRPGLPCRTVPFDSGIV